ncbi:MAG: multicopper oxidase domain-containing protein [Afipia sp.]|jgi:FtsP/CotA-like multicopper oxidase with cupredoxin domain|nr:multicopper oxidase domain-containing protein [Afipia sp.]
MFVQPIDYFLVVWFVLAAASTLYVGIDQYRNNPEPVVMKWGFILVTLYMGPLGLLLYVLADKEPRPGEHEDFTRPLWKQGVGSTIHCVAGDATGIILAAVITAMLGLPMWIDLIVEYLAGFAFGLFIFQSLFMKSMMGGTYWENVRKSFLPEFISMNFMMAGMAPVMSFLMMGRDMRAMEPTELLFWGVMSIGVIAGFALAYPANVWLVARGLKHGLMTERSKTEAPAPSEPNQHPMAEMHGARMPSREQHSSHAAESRTAAKPEHASHASHGANKASAHHGGHQMSSDATTAQVAALGAVSLLALALGMISPANWLNMTLSARDVGGAIMPPGMIMDRNTPADAMRDMAAVDPRLVTASFGADAKGDQELPFRMDNGVKVFELKPSVVKWTILPGVTVDAYAYNGQIPGPRIHIKQGDRIRVNVTNDLPEETTIHWHGMILPNQMDGPAEITQDPIKPGGSFSYEFTATQHGTYFYHPHAKPDREQALGLYGALIIDPANPADEVPADHDYVIQLQEWLKREGLTYPSMPMDGGQPNYFTINGKAYPATDTIHMKVGETLKVRFIGSNNGFIHPMHIHGGPFEVVARDGETIPASARFLADTVNVGPGQRYDVVWTAREPGKWLIHCHIPHHTTNNNAEEKGGGGLMVVIDVE